MTKTIVQFWSYLFLPWIYYLCIVAQACIQKLQQLIGENMLQIKLNSFKITVLPKRNNTLAPD